MTNQPEAAENTKAQKYCGGCGQKNFRPNRSLGELLSEFVEDWLGFDSKIYKTGKALCIPAKLSSDYFANSHHKNHYITPIRLYLLLSVIFFVMTQFGGLNVTEIELNDLNKPKIEMSEAERKETQKNIDEAIAETDSDIAKQILTDVKQEISDEDSSGPTSNGDTPFDLLSKACGSDPTELINLWPEWLEHKIEGSAQSLCDRYEGINYLPEDQRKKARIEFGFSILQNFIEVLPQVFFLCLPILALLLSVFYFLSKRLYVEHLVLLMHSHSFIFAVILTYLGWYKLAEFWPTLQAFPMEVIFSIGIVIYLYLTQKWFYQRGWWATLWRFCIFGFIYSILLVFIAVLAAFVGIMSF